MAVVQTKSGIGAARKTRHINRKPASNFHHARKIAEVIGKGLNLLVTINFGSDDEAHKTASQRVQKLVSSRFTPWIRRPSKKDQSMAEPPTYAWVLENVHGVHFHMMVHVPTERMKDFNVKIRGWSSEMLCRELYEGDVDIRQIRSGCGIKQYLLKGMDKRYASLYGVMPEDQGVIIGKRSGVSRNVGPTARKRLIQRGLYPACKRRSVPFPRQPHTTHGHRPPPPF